MQDQAIVNISNIYVIIVNTVNIHAGSDNPEQEIKIQCSYFIKQLNGFPWRIAWRLLEGNIPRAWIQPNLKNDDKWSNYVENTDFGFDN